MAKRFTDTAKWKDTWFQDLPAKYKLFWIYILDECDQAGVYKPNLRLASFQIGEPFEEIEVKRILGNRIEVLENGYWFVRKFISFQYGELSENSKPHISVLRLINEYGIKGYAKSIDALKDKYKEKEKDQEEDKEKENSENSEIKSWNIKPLASDVGELPDVVINQAIELIFSTKAYRVSRETIKNMYNIVFVPQYLKGRKVYQYESDVHEHFINWIRLQKFDARQQQPREPNVGAPPLRML